MTWLRTPLKREIEIDDLTPQELAEQFCDMFGDKQAEFFNEVWRIAKHWPGAGWCQQSCEIVKHLDAGGLDAVKVLYSHTVDSDD